MTVGSRVSSQAQNTATSTARSQMNDIVGALMGKNCYFGQYRALGLNQRCSKCSHKEPWAAINFNWLRNFIFKIGGIVLFIDAPLFILNTIALFAGKNRGSAQHRSDIIGEFVTLGIAALLVGGFFLYLYISSNYAYKKDKEISKLPRSALPILVIDGSPVIDYEALERIEAEKSAQIEAKKKEAEERRKQEERTKQELEANAKRILSPLQDNSVQQKDKSAYTEKNIASYTPYSAADEIEKFKGLLDKGIITQEEFDAKKKQLLGI